MKRTNRPPVGGCHDTSPRAAVQFNGYLHLRLIFLHGFTSSCRQPAVVVAAAFKGVSSHQKVSNSLKTSENQRAAPIVRTFSVRQCRHGDRRFFNTSLVSSVSTSVSRVQNIAHSLPTQGHQWTTTFRSDPQNHNAPNRTESMTSSDSRPLLRARSTTALFQKLLFWSGYSGTYLGQVRVYLDCVLSWDVFWVRSGCDRVPLGQFSYESLESGSEQESRMMS